MGRKITSSDIKKKDFDKSYSLGMSTDTKGYTYKSKKGLSKKLVEDISRRKEEPSWMLDLRLKALDEYESRPIPTWGGDLSQIEWDNIYYYLKPTDKKYGSWDEVPDDIRGIFDKIGVPQAEREHLAGVGGQYDSEVIYHSLKKTLSKQGVVFLGMDDGLREYPEIVREHFSTVIPRGDNKLAALNTAVWSGGSFVYVPKGVKVTLPLQAYFRINSERAGQFERTLIVAEEGSEVEYVEGCFPAGSKVLTDKGEKNIESVDTNDKVLSHTGVYRKINNLQKRSFSGDLYFISYYGDPSREITVTEEHPFLVVKRKSKNDRNKNWDRQWIKPGKLNKGDYLAIPVEKKVKPSEVREFEVKRYLGKKKGYEIFSRRVPCTKEFFRLIGYYLAEGSISSDSYLNFSFSSSERKYIEDVKLLMAKVFGVSKSHENKHKKNNGISVVFSSREICSIFSHFGKGNDKKRVPEWVIFEDLEKQKELIKGWFRGDGNYYSRRHDSGYKEAFRVNTTSSLLIKQMQRVLRRLGVPAFVNARDRRKENRKTMYTLGVTGEWMTTFGEIVEIPVRDKINGKRRASMFGFDGEYVYVPIKKIKSKRVSDLSVYNFGVSVDESYVAEGVAVHNCSAPAYSSGSLHAAVVEVVVKKGARVRYTTVQNWYKNVYNLVTKRATVEENGRMEWVDANLGSKLTMKYPSCVLKGEGASGDMLSIAVSGQGQHQDAGAKMFHLAPNTKSRIISKSISKDGGRATYRGMVTMSPNAKGSRSRVVCDALILDEESRSDTYPTNKIMTNDATLEHEAVVSRVGEEQLFYLMSRGFSEEGASSMIVKGFLEPVIKELPLEYAVELNRLVELEMEGSVG